MTPYVYNALLVRVIDGDTVDINIDLGFNAWIFERVRLDSIDTPEVRTPEGIVSKTFTVHWMAGAKKLFLHSLKYDAREKYGRVLGDFYRVDYDTGNDDPVSLCAALRAAGHVKA